MEQKFLPRVRRCDPKFRQPAGETTKMTLSNILQSEANIGIDKVEEKDDDDDDDDAP